MHHRAGGEIGAMALVLGHPHAQLVQVGLRLLQQVPLDAHMPEERHGHAHLLARAAMRGMRGAGTHMLADHLRRNQQRRVALDVGTLHRVHAVGGPDAVRHLQDAQVHTAAARRAALDLQTGVRGLQITEDAVDGQRLLVYGGTRVLRRERLGDQLVVVPLDIVDAQFFDQLVHAVVHVVVGLRVGQIDDLLATALHRQAVGRGLEHPIRMVAEHLGIRIHHLRLEPQAELHALAMHVIGKRLEALRAFRPHLLGDLPVAKAGGVVTTGAEPAVVHHETLHAAVGGLVGERDQRVIVLVEVHGLPGVEDHRTRLDGHLGMAGAHIPVEAGGDLVQAVAVRAIHPRRLVCAVVGQRHFAAEQDLPAADHGLRIGQTFGRQQAVAAPCHMCGVHLTVFESESGGAHCQQQRGVEVGTAGHIGALEPADGQRLALRGTLAQVVAGGGQDLGGPAGDGEAEFDLADLQFAVGQVADGGTLAEQAGGVELHRPGQGHLLFGVLGGHGDGGAIAFSQCGVGHGEPAEHLHAVAAQRQARFADPSLRLSRQHARPRRVIERAGHALGAQGVGGVHDCFRVSHGAAPVHKPRQFPFGERQRKRHAGFGLLRIHRNHGGGFIGQCNDARHCTTPSWVGSVGRWFRW